jgi:hypothetical protein
MMGSRFFCRRWWSGGRGGMLWLGIGGIGLMGRAIGYRMVMQPYSLRDFLLNCLARIFERINLV